MPLIYQRILDLLKHKSAANIFWQFLEKFVTLGLTFIVSIYLTRYLGPTNYGILSYANSYVLLFTALTTLGLQTIVIRELSRTDIDQAVIMGSAFAIMLCGSLVAAILAIGGAVFTNDKLVVIVLIAFGCLTNIVASFSVINYYLMSELKSRYTSYVVIGQKIIDSLLILVLIHYKCGIIAIGSLLVVEAVIVYIILYFLYVKVSIINTWKFSLKMMKFLLHQSIPLAISGAVINLYMRLDQVMIEYFRGLDAVGIYSVGIKLSELLYILPGVFSVNVFPLMVKKYSQAPDEFNQFMVKMYRVFFYAAVLLACGFFIVAKPLVLLLYGKQYLLSGTVFKYGVLSIVAAFIGVINHLWLQIKGLQRYAVYITLSGLLCCFSLNLVLIPAYGVIGAVIVMVITQSVASVFAFILFSDTRQCFRLFIYGVTFKPLPVIPDHSTIYPEK